MSINFDRLTVAQCVVPPVPVPDPRCEDSAFAISNPDVCSTIGALIIKPSVVLLCELDSVQFKVYEFKNGVETELTTGVTFESSDDGVFTIGVAGGSGTALGAGNAEINATDGSRTVTASITVLPGVNCCSAVRVLTAIVVDNSRSMSLAFGGGYSTRLVFAKAVASSYGGILLSNEAGVKDSDKVWSLNQAATEITSGFSQSTSAILAAIASIAQSQEKTNVLEAFAFAAQDLLISDGDRRVLLLISDGEQTSSESTRQEILDAAYSYKEAGGIVIVIGVRASGQGYDLLQRLASGGFFINATSGNVTEVMDGLNYMKNLLCAGSCMPVGDTYENLPELNYSSFLNWEVASGQVNLLGPGLLDLLPGNGLYVELAYSGAPVPTILRSIDAYNLVAGRTYTISFKMGGNQVNPVAGIPPKVYLRSTSAVPTDPNIFEQSMGVTWNSPFSVYNFSFTAVSNAAARLYFEHQPNGANTGVMLDDIAFRDVTTGNTLLSDNFDHENLHYVNPRCGQSAAVPPIDDPAAPTVQEVPYANGDNVNGDSYSYKISFVTNDGQTAASPVATIVTTNEVDRSLRLTIPTPPESVTAVRIYRNVVDGNSTNLFLLDVIPPGNVYFFDTETHAQFIDRYDPDQTPPTENTTGHAAGELGYGYYCDIYDCTSESPGVQSPDPSPLPDIESGFTPPAVYSSTRSACVSCPAGSVNVSDTPLASTLVSSSNVSPEYYIDQLTGGPAILRKFCVKGGAGLATFNDLKLYGSAAAAGPWTLLLEASTPLYVASNAFACFVLENTTAYGFVKVEVSSVQGGGVGPVHIVDYRQPDAYYLGAPETQCASASATSYVSQQDADNQATAAAQSAATELLNCTAAYTSTQSYTAQCPNGTLGNPITKSVTRTSLISQADADSQALQAAQAAAEAELSCGNSNNTQRITIGNQVGPARPFPSVLFLSGYAESDVITKLTLTLKRVGSNVNLLRYVNAILVSPAGTAVNFYRKVLHNCAVPIELTNPAAFPFGTQRVNSITFDDDAASPFPVCPPSPAGDLNANVDYTFQPTVSGAATDLPSPAPAGPYGVALSDFDGESPNGSWSLWIAVDTEPYYGAVIDLGFELTLTVA
jgi:hypothetical protein